MRRTLGKLPNPNLTNVVTKQSLISTSTSAFSTSSAGGGGGGGRGRGRGSSGPPTIEFTARTPGKTTDSDDTDPKKDESLETPFPSGLGHGRGKPLPSTAGLPSFSSFVPGMGAGSGTGRGRVGVGNLPPQSRPQQEQEQFGPRQPIFFSKEDDTHPMPKPQPVRNMEESSDLPESILSVLTGVGRGKPGTPPASQEENIRQEDRPPRGVRKPDGRRGRGVGEGITDPPAKLSRENATKKAMGILSRGNKVEESGGRGRGFRGRGRGSQGRGWGGRGERRGGRGQDSKDDYGTGLYLGDDADGEKLAKRIGTENMSQLVEGFDEMSGRVLPSPAEDAYLDALHTNYMIECEPEYLMEEFGTNPDIDEKPPIPLRDALEKMKPFLMAYEGIKSQEEWEEVMKETMEKVPIIKELVDHYSGPDRVTAKRQQEELERVGKTLPNSAPTSVKRFTERAILSLQSNPGWGFDKKCQFMDKLVWEVSQQYK